MTVAWHGDTIRVSNSEIQTFKDCRRKWWFAYYRELGFKRSETEVSGARSLGTRVHLALEGLYTREENPLQVLHDVYLHDAQEFEAAGRSPEEVAELWKEYDLANAMVSGYLDWATEEGVDDGLELVASEDVIEVPSHVPGVMLRGKLDQRVVRKVDGARLFRDFKTVGDLKTPMATLHMDEQMKFYQLLEHMESLHLTNREPQWRTDGALYLMLRKVKRTAAAKPPFYGQLEVHHNAEEIRTMWYRVAKIIEEIVQARQQLDAGGNHHYVVPPRPSRDCTWKCDFFAVCSMADDGSDLDGALGEYYERVDPHRRYAKEETKGEVVA